LAIAVSSVAMPTPSRTAASAAHALSRRQAVGCDGGAAAGASGPLDPAAGGAAGASGRSARETGIGAIGKRESAGH
jgi:hypothetical protein